MLQSTLNIYTINIPLAILQFVFLLLINKAMKILKRSIQIFKHIYNFFSAYSIIWVLYVATIESNIAPIAFFGSVQFNVFISFDIFSKFNLIFTVLLVFLVFIYTFIIYPLIVKYGVKKYVAKMFDISKFGLTAFWL